MELNDQALFDFAYLKGLRYLCIIECDHFSSSGLDSLINNIDTDVTRVEIVMCEQIQAADFAGRNVNIMNDVLAGFESLVIEDGKDKVEVYGGANNGCGGGDGEMMDVDM